MNETTKVEIIGGEIQKVIKYIAYEFVKGGKSYLTTEDFEKFSEVLGVEINILKQIYSNQKYRKHIESTIQNLRNEMKIGKLIEKEEYLDDEEKCIFVKDKFYIDIENTDQLNLRTGEIDIHISDKLYSLYDLLNEERLFLLQFQRKGKGNAFSKFIADRIIEIKKIRKKINHILVSISRE